MPTHITPKTDDILVLRLNLLTELKACGLSVTGGTMASAIPDFVSAATHITMGAGTGFALTFVTFAATTCSIYEAMERRAMGKQQYHMTTMKRPKIDI